MSKKPRSPPLVIRPGQYSPEVLRFLRLLCGAKNIDQVLILADGRLRQPFLAPDQPRKGA
jgi:hypothetical protein